MLALILHARFHDQCNVHRHPVNSHQSHTVLQQLHFLLRLVVSIMMDLWFLWPETCTVAHGVPTWMRSCTTIGSVSFRFAHDKRILTEAPSSAIRTDTFLSTHLFFGVAVGFILVSKVSVTMKLPMDSHVPNLVMDVHSSSETASSAVTVITKAPIGFTLHVRFRARQHPWSRMVTRSPRSDALVPVPWVTAHAPGTEHPFSPTHVAEFASLWRLTW